MAEPLLVASALTVALDGATRVRDLELGVAAGTICGIVGRSGTGKSTLARSLVGLHAHGGSLRLEGREVRFLSGPARARIQLVFQDARASLDPRRTVARLLADARSLAGLAPLGEGGAEHLLANLGLDHAVMRRRPPALSGGQCRLVAVARALACEPRVLVLDEPTAALDRALAWTLHDHLTAARDRGLALVIASHDLAWLRALADEILVLEDGAVVERGSSDEVCRTPRHAATRALVSALVV